MYLHYQNCSICFCNEALEERFHSGGIYTFLPHLPVRVGCYLAVTMVKFVWMDLSSFLSL